MYMQISIYAYTFGDCRCESRFPMIDMSDRTNVAMRLVPVKYLLRTVKPLRYQIRQIGSCSQLTVRLLKKKNAIIRKDFISRSIERLGLGRRNLVEFAYLFNEMFD